MIKETPEPNDVVTDFRVDLAREVEADLAVDCEFGGVRFRATRSISGISGGPLEELAVLVPSHRCAGLEIGDPFILDQVQYEVVGENPATSSGLVRLSLGSMTL